jgi:hypothetical protein
LQNLGGAASNMEKAYRERLQHQLFFYSVSLNSNTSTVEEEGNQQPSLASSVNYLPKSGNSRKTPKKIRLKLDCNSHPQISSS